MPNPQRTRVAIACQGGGSHTAFTAGVLTALLRSLPPNESDSQSDVEVVALSGTSGGAICALLAWDGLLQGEPERGPKTLKRSGRTTRPATPGRRCSTSPSGSPR